MLFAPHLRAARSHPHPVQTLPARSHPSVRRLSLPCLAACACMLVLASDALTYHAVHIFPTRHLLYMVPPDWTSYIGFYPPNTSPYAEYEVGIFSPDKHQVGTTCRGTDCSEWVTVATVDIQDFEAGGYTDVRDWLLDSYQEPPSFDFWTTVFAGQPAYCDPRYSLSPSRDAFQMIISGGICSILWRDRIYQIRVFVDEIVNLQQAYPADFEQILRILQSIQFI